MLRPPLTERVQAVRVIVVDANNPASKANIPMTGNGVPLQANRPDPYNSLSPAPPSRAVMPLLPWKTAERRIGVLGPNWAGKTVFLTSLINHLSSHDPRYFHLGSGRVSAEVRKFRR